MAFRAHVLQHTDIGKQMSDTRGKAADSLIHNIAAGCIFEGTGLNFAFITHCHCLFCDHVPVQSVNAHVIHCQSFSQILCQGFKKFAAVRISHFQQKQLGLFNNFSFRDVRCSALNSGYFPGFIVNRNILCFCPDNGSVFSFPAQRKRSSAEPAPEKRLQQMGIIRMHKFHSQLRIIIMFLRSVTGYSFC